MFATAGVDLALAGQRPGLLTLPLNIIAVLVAHVSIYRCCSSFAISPSSFFDLETPCILTLKSSPLPAVGQCCGPRSPLPYMSGVELYGSPTALQRPYAHVV